MIPHYVVRNEPGSIGNRAALQCEIKTVDESGVEVKTDEIGEIILRGAGNLKGYYKEEEKTKEVLKDHWLYTGIIRESRHCKIIIAKHANIS